MGKYLGAMALAWRAGVICLWVAHLVIAESGESAIPVEKPQFGKADALCSNIQRSAKHVCGLLGDEHEGCVGATQGADFVCSKLKRQDTPNEQPRDVGEAQLGEAAAGGS